MTKEIIGWDFNRVQLIEKIKELDGYERASFYYLNDYKCNVLRLFNYEKDFSITVVTQERFALEDTDWDDTEWVEIVRGYIEDIEEIITEELYKDIIKQMKIRKEN